VKTRTSGSVVRFAAPIRAWAQRFSLTALTCAAVVLLMLGKVDTVLIEAVRARVTDAFTPLLDAFSRPAATAARGVETVIALNDAFEENKRLKEENERLLQWRQAATRLEAENKSLRGLLNYAPDHPVTRVTGRVVAAPGGSFVRSLVVTAGERDGVRKGQAALSGSGMVGRVIDVGDRSSRVLLITDINTRIPVMLENSRVQAVLAGDNSPQPKLLYLPPETPPTVGDRVVTSGHGGLFPAGIPVGVVASVGERGVRVEAFADPDRLEHVQLVDYGVVTGPGDSEATQQAR